MSLDVQLTVLAERGARLAEQHPDSICPCGRPASQHSPGMWGTCSCGRLIHRFGPGGITRCARCRSVNTLTTTQENR